MFPDSRGIGPSFRLAVASQGLGGGVEAASDPGLREVLPGEVPGGTREGSRLCVFRDPWLTLTLYIYISYIIHDI